MFYLDKFMVEFESTRLKAHVAPGWSTEHEPEINVNQVAMGVQKDVAVVSVKINKIIFICEKHIEYSNEGGLVAYQRNRGYVQKEYEYVFL